MVWGPQGVGGKGQGSGTERYQFRVTTEENKSQVLAI